jgi:hypothetical protein
VASFRKVRLPAEIGLSAVLDGAPLFDGDGRLRSADVGIGSRVGCPLLPGLQTGWVASRLPLEPPPGTRLWPHNAVTRVVNGWPRGTGWTG